MTTRSAESVSPAVGISVPTSAIIPPDVLETAARLGVSQHMPEIIRMTREVFGSFSRACVSDDLEFGDAHIVFHVAARGTIEEELEREEQWGRRVKQVIPRSPQVYLVCVDYES
jgi:hypothetical protein